jgi:isopenicillin-N epimerase
MEEARQALASYLRAAPEHLVFVTNSTFAVNIIARSLNLNPQDQVLTSNHEYGAMTRVWQFLSRKYGFHLNVRNIPVPLPSQDEVVDILWKGVNEHTRVIFLSHITSPTAVLLPIQAICQRAKENGILTVIDGAHAPGQIPLALDEFGVDFYVGNLHKWVCAPKGAGFLYAPVDKQHLLDPLVVSWGWESDDPGASLFVDHHEWQGTRDPAAFLAVPTAIRFLEDHQWTDVQQISHKLAMGFQERITALTLKPQIATPDHFAQMVAVIMTDLDPLETQIRLFDDYQIEVPLFYWKSKPLMRISVQGYNDQGDIDQLLEALRDLL